MEFWVLGRALAGAGWCWLVLVGTGLSPCLLYICILGRGNWPHWPDWRVLVLGLVWLGLRTTCLL